MLDLFKRQWGSLPSLGKIAAGVVLATGLITGIASAWPIVEFIVPAHRGYVVEQVGDIRTPVNELLIWRFEDTKNKARGEAADWSIKLPKEQDPQTRVMIERRIEQLNVEQKQLDERIGKLKRQ